MIEVPIYVPSRTGTGRDARMGNHLAATVAPGSAIVGRDKPDPDLIPDMVVVYYEGNLHNAVNMVTFADRAMFAYWRMRDHYPTVAMMAVPLNQLQRAATLYPDYGRVEVADVTEQIALSRWLDIDIADSAQLASQMRTEGVRVGGGSVR